ncbi:GNAT family N-acetyltransferase [Euzebya tangerina]|uniref:GNAT family N-acetyltransferase n=1 Tax=Euzebya tangerina TaxID=591198 RepID=UPI000E318F9F|nr:GNAT family N-acetyltransferase [Euzebya tangerina]
MRAPADSLTYRPFTTDEADDALDLLGLVFGEEFDDADRAAEMAIQDVSRSIAAFDSGRLVGCLGDYGLELSVPGGTVACAGTTWVGVSPTHRRRGIARRMLTDQLLQARDRGEPLAALWASEATIYGRWGFAPSIDLQKLVVDVHGGLAFKRGAAGPADSVRLVPLEEARTVIEPIYEATRRRRAGLHGRSEGWWDFQVLSTRKSCLAGATDKVVAVATRDGRDVAYAAYGMTWVDVADQQRMELRVTELAGVDPAAEIAMWRFLAGHDLLHTIRAPRRPVDDSLPLAVEDVRRITRTRSDALYVRVLDVRAALLARSYVGSASVTVAVHDDLITANRGVWRIEVAPEGASVEQVDDDSSADISLDIHDLAAVYMGDVRAMDLLRAGLIDATSPEAVRDFDAALAAPEAGWPPEVW